MKELIKSIAKALVDYPDEVQVTQVNGEKTTVLELRVAKADLGKVIGKEGKTARSMRILLGAVAKKASKKVVLEIIEED